MRESITVRATWKIRSHAAPACREGDFTGAEYKPPLKTTLLGESKRLLASQKWGQDNGSIQGKMVIRGRNSISSEMQDAAKARPWFGVLR